MDELDDILEAMRSREGNVSALAQARLMHTPLESDGVRRILDAVDQGFGHSHPDTERWVRSAGIRAAAMHANAAASERLVGHYSSVDSGARSSILDFLARMGTPDSLRKLAELAATEGDEDPALLPRDRLMEHAEHAEIFLLPLFELPDESAMRYAALLLAADLSDEGRLRLDALVSQREWLREELVVHRDALRALSESRRRGDELAMLRRHAIGEASAVLLALGCADAESTLREVAERGEPELRPLAARLLRRAVVK